jgi:hypothetical protein
MALSSRLPVAQVKRKILVKKMTKNEAEDN